MNVADHSCKIKSSIFLEIKVKGQKMLIIKDGLLCLILEILRAFKFMNIRR